jgi:hypothetical protein
MGWQDAPVVNAWEQAPIADATGVDRAQAAASGVNRGALVNLAGLPVATALNAWDLLKAGAGVGYHEMTGKPVPDALAPSDRAQMVGSPEWIANRIEGAGAGQVINANRPDDQASRLLHAGGQGVAAGLAAPQNIPQALANAGTAAASLASGEFAAEHGAGPAGQILASAAVPGAVSAAASRAQSAQAAAAKTAAQRAPVNQTIAETQEAGYVYPPSQTNPSLLNKVVGGIGGKAATEQAAALKNQDTTNGLVRQGLGLHEDTPLSLDTLAQVRRDAAKDYEPIRQFGTFQATPDYVRQIIGLRNEYMQSTGGMPSLRIPAVESLLNDAARPGFSSNSTVELIRRLRSDADTGFRSDDPARVNTARVQKGVANALETMIGDNLAASGQQSLLDKFQQARQTIAKTYTVEDALNPSTGNVDARKLATALGKGTPMTGELATAAKAGGFAPLATREFTQTPPGLSVLDATIAGGAGLAGASTGHPTLALGALYPVARMAARGVALSGPYQRTFARVPGVPEPSALAQLLTNGGGGSLPTLPAAPATAALQSDSARRRLLAQALLTQGVQ